MTAADHQALRAAHVALDRAHAEVELLATCADSPRRSLAILRELGVGVEHFTSDDTRALFVAIESANEAPCDGERLAQRARYLLAAAGCWDARDFRPFVCTSRWGPGPLAALLCRVPFDAEVVRGAGLRLLGLDALAEGRRQCA